MESRPYGPAAPGAIDAIRSHLQRGDLTDGRIFDAVRISPLEIGEAVKHCRMICWPRSRRSRGGRSPACATTSATFDTAHAISQATVDENLPDLEHAVRSLADSLPDEAPRADSGHP
jgi:hypothetical protein